MEQISSLLAAAAVGGFAITAVAGKFMIPALHRLHFGQTIREEGPTWHSKKNGTPTMGGLCFILGILATLGIVWVMYSPKLPEVLGMPQLQAGMLVLFLAFGSGLIGFLDDFIKVVKHRNLGLTEAQKMILQIALTFGFMFGLHSLGLLTTQVQFPTFWAGGHGLALLSHRVLRHHLPCQRCQPDRRSGRPVHRRDLRVDDRLSAGRQSAGLCTCFADRRCHGGCLRGLSGLELLPGPRSLWATPAACSSAASLRRWPL